MFEHLYASNRLPLWSRVTLYALDHDGHHLERGQLLYAVDPHRLLRSAELSRAIRCAVTRGLLLPGSSAAVLYFAHHVEQEAA